MKKRKINPIIVAIIVLFIMLLVIVYLYVTPSNKASLLSSKTSSKSTNTTSSTDSSNTAKVSKQTIENTLSSSGQISSALDEKEYLHAGYYFYEMLYDTNVFIEEGEKIVKYTNGTYLTAPYDCVITSYNVPNQSEICTTSHYIEIQSLDTLCMSLSVSETDIGKVEIGDVVNITITATSEVLQGHITSLSEVGTYSSSGSYFTAKVTFENSGSLKIGMSASCEIVIESAENVLAVPNEAIQTSDDGKYVIVVKDSGETENVTVTTGISNDAYIEIKSGLTGSETVQLSTSSSSSSSSSSFPNSDFSSNFGGGRSGSGSEGGGMSMPGGGGSMPDMPSF